uniref:Hirudin-P6 n=1 Tax=Hirudinaria manillensis TaxID=1348078 RepID=HIRP6_HIRMN|nr:RecName: Full=Hirudin-P6 [Hirudinaria manillensis]AAB21615.1 hirudin P6 [Hirudinaria manillensis=buffalo leech, Peptide, 63 aa] [Hirudinaria manillensis]
MRYTACTESGQNQCICEGNDVCGQGRNCQFDSSGKKCVEGEGTRKPQNEGQHDFDPIPEEYLS